MRKFVVKPQSVKIQCSETTRKRIVAAYDDEDDDLFGPVGDDTEGDGLQDTLDDVADTVDDIQDAVDETEPDSVCIEGENNISGHYIAECGECHGIFITAVQESDQKINSISGTCPLCERDTDQTLRWVIHDVEDTNEQPENNNWGV